MSIVAHWRSRARDLRATYWRCDGCGRLAAVRRAACAGCGEVTTAATARAPHQLRALECSHAHLVFEAMDQRSGLAAVMLAETENAQPLAFPLCETDAAHRLSLVGEMLELVLRRKQNRLGANEPIFYIRKLAATASTRARIKQTETTKG